MIAAHHRDGPAARAENVRESFTLRRGHLQTRRERPIGVPPFDVIDSRLQRLIDPPGPGFARLTVIDATGAADTVVVRIQ